MAIAEMAMEDGEYRRLAGEYVETAIAPSEASFSTAFDALRDDGAVNDATNSTSDSFSDGKLRESWEVNADV